MSHTYTTQDGKTARLVNPYTYPAAPKLHIDFERNNPPIPLTTERPDLIGKEFQGEVVWQLQQVDENWQTVQWDVSGSNWKYKRLAVEPIEKPLEGEEKALDIYSWNKAIDAAIKLIANNRDVFSTSADIETEGVLLRNIDYGVALELTNQINLLNSLRK